ncbi:hypothetical protein PABG_06822 [Paracoccidioides brasiliensis Pb03]|uniref:F-box domain-containing protein n=1 Tax=Paracoccidioides brasiliensis (strain Pb18) TaxID=502780 RepID=C1GGA9_PARBD|nr:uncharacterized protein PADG_06346 [Paracoccidioides brasiliensis Pb18]EEH16735.1 hypothetical protein PABG_06822 [Paracoccidioides brasiliensis Pb03]EEH50267.1 hypothetical protein PADG_06346 [Paracoccidioides brasiliensis Pb18]
MSDKPTLQFLPGEILHIIHSFLSAGSKLTFSLTCKRFYNSFFENVPQSYLSDPVKRQEFQQIVQNSAVIDDLKVYEFMLARELCGFKSGPKLCCSACSSTHLPLFFHPRDLAKHSNERVCLKHIKGLWIEPGKCFSFADLHLSCGPIDMLYKVQTPRCAALSLDDRYVYRYLLWTHYDILTLPRDERASKEQIAKILDGFDLPTCPHLRLSDRMIIDLYDSPLNTVEEPLNQERPPIFDPTDIRAKCTFPCCLTSVCWTTHTSVEDPQWKTIYLHVLRKIRINTAIDRVWLAQLMLPNDALLRQQHWDDCFRWKSHMLAIERERYENEAREGADGGGGDGFATGACSEAYLARETLLRQREDVVNRLFHPRRPRNGQDLVRGLGGKIKITSPNPINNIPMDSVNGGNEPEIPTQITSNQRPWTPPASPLITSEMCRDIFLENPSLPESATPLSDMRYSGGELFSPLFNADEFQRYGKRGPQAVIAEERRKQMSWFGRLFTFSLW